MDDVLERLDNITIVSFFCSGDIVNNKQTMEYHQVIFCVSWTEQKCQVSNYSGDRPAIRELPQHVVEEDQEGGEERHRVGEAAAPDNEHVGDGGELADFPAVLFHISHWYLTSNTIDKSKCNKSQLSRAINY